MIGDIRGNVRVQGGWGEREDGGRVGSSDLIFVCYFDYMTPHTSNSVSVK